MNYVESLVLQGHINAVEFFGVNLKTVKHLKLDMMDELATAVINGASVSNYRGMQIRRNNQFSV